MRSQSFLTIHLVVFSVKFVTDKALKQNSELFTQDVKEQGSWFIDFKEAHHLLFSPLCFPVTRPSSGVNTEEGMFSDRNCSLLECEFKN